jgi:hypothetical protein
VVFPKRLVLRFGVMLQAMGSAVPSST